eukprot:gene4504-8956_t
MSYPGALTIPHGRSFIAQNYGVAFIYKSHKSSKLTLSNLTGNHGMIWGTIEPCILNHTLLNIPKIKTGIIRLCFVTFYGQLIGPEILVATITRSEISKQNECTWTVSFPPVSSTSTGIYELCLRTDWIFGDRNRAPDKISQITSFSLNEGLTTHIGYSDKDIIPLREEFIIRTFISGTILPITTTPRTTTPRTTTSSSTKTAIFYPKPNISHEFRKVLNELQQESIESYFFGDESWEQSSVLYSRNQVIIESDATNNNNINDNINTSSTIGYAHTDKILPVSSLQSLPALPLSSLPLPLCTNGNMKGRWVKEPFCDGYKQTHVDNRWLASHNEWPLPGSECSHSIRPWNKRSRNHSVSMVWRPYECTLAHYSNYYDWVYMHGFRYTWQSPGRMYKFNEVAKSILSSSGWEILDTTQITAGRPDGVVDTLHYRGGVSWAITDTLLTMICHRVDKL